MVGAHSHGQGHETSFPQVVAEMLGIDPGDGRYRAWRYVQDPVWHGHLWLPLLAVCGSAMVRATEKIIAKAKKIAAHLLEASEADIELEGRPVQRRGHR